MIIHSTTLDTEAKVKAIYGSNTSWIQHSGYVLRGASSGVVSNSATKTGGNDNAIVPYHRHSFVSAHASIPSGGAWFDNTPPAARPLGGSYQNDVTNYTAYEGTSGNATNANIPNYKSVYIWERIA